MKKAASILICLLFAFTALYPTGVIISACLGYSFEPLSISALVTVLAALSACIMILDRIGKNMLESKFIRILVSILTPLSLLNAIFSVFACPNIWVIISAIQAVGCSCYLTIRYTRPKPLKITALAISAPMLYLFLLMCLFANMGQDTVVKTVESPDGACYAQVIDRNEGALGGHTYVDVHKKGSIDLFLFKIEKKPQRVYYGKWAEYENMQIYWKNDTCLVINSVEYEIE